MKILLTLVFFIILIAVWILKKTYGFLDVDINKLERYLNVLRFMGDVSSNENFLNKHYVFLNGSLLISFKRKHNIVLIKSKKDLKVNFEILISATDNEKLRLRILKGLVKKGINFYQLKEPKFPELDDFVIDVGNDYNEINKLIKFIFKEFFEIEPKKIDLFLYNINKNLILNENLTISDNEFYIPLTNWDWLLGKLRLKRIDYSYKDDVYFEKK